MLLTVKKQIEETLEVKTPAYYKDPYGYYYINAEGQLVTIRDTMIAIWNPGTHCYDDSIRDAIKGKPSEKEEFELAYQKVIGKAKEVNS